MLGGPCRVCLVVIKHADTQSQVSVSGKQGTGKAFQPTSVVRGAASAESQDCGPIAVPMRALSGLQLVSKAADWGLLVRKAHTQAGTCGGQVHGT